MTSPPAASMRETALRSALSGITAPPCSSTTAATISTPPHRPRSAAPTPTMTAAATARMSISRRRPTPSLSTPPETTSTPAAPCAGATAAAATSSTRAARITISPRRSDSFPPTTNFVPIRHRWAACASIIPSPVKHPPLPASASGKPRKSAAASAEPPAFFRALPVRGGQAGHFFVRRQTRVAT